MKQYDDDFTTLSRKEIRSNLGTERKKTWAELSKKKQCVKKKNQRKNNEWN